MHFVVVGVLSGLIAGCYNPTMIVDGRTALEQELTRVAILKSLDKLPILKSVRSGRWKIEVVSPYKADDSWTRALMRQRLTELGAVISTNATENISVVEAIVEYASSDVDNFILGIPIPGTLGNSSFGLYHDNSERGRARIRINFWSKEGKLLAQTPVALGETHYSDITVLTFIGPFSFTDLDDVKATGRFTKLGVDEWMKVRRALKHNNEETSNLWIE